MKGRVLKYPLKALDSLADRLVSLIGAVAFSQAPGFMAHYLQRLGGHLSEARLNVASWQRIADEATAGSLQELVALYRSAGATEIAAAGRKCAADIQRLHHLQDALTAITDAPAWSRIWAFIRHADGEIAYAALQGYVPNVPLDLEGLAYALGGLLIGFGLYQGTRGSIRLALRRRRARKMDAAKNEEEGSHAPDKGDDIGEVAQGEGTVAVDGDIEGRGGGDRET